MNRGAVVSNPRREGTQRKEKGRYSILEQPLPSTSVRVRYCSRAASHELTQEGNQESASLGSKGKALEKVGGGSTGVNPSVECRHFTLVAVDV